MKKISLSILTIVVLLSATSCSISCSISRKAEKVVEPVNILTNEVDSMSYALGTNFGIGLSNNLKEIPGGKYSIEALIKGFEQALRNDSNIIFTQESAQKYFTEYMEKAQKIENEKHKKAGEDFLAANKIKSGVSTTPSGLQYIVLKNTEGAKPLASDMVKVHYTGSTIDGKIFDSSVKRGTPAEFKLNQVIPGWTEGVQLMSVGSKFKFFIPYNLAYGESGQPRAGIPPYAPLIFEIELLDIIK